jgi:hypothetical protein
MIASFVFLVQNDHHVMADYKSIIVNILFYIYHVVIDLFINLSICEHTSFELLFAMYGLYASLT